MNNFDRYEMNFNTSSHKKIFKEKKNQLQLHLINIFATFCVQPHKLNASLCLCTIHNHKLTLCFKYFVSMYILYIIYNIHNIFSKAVKLSNFCFKGRDIILKYFYRFSDKTIY